MSPPLGALLKALAPGRTMWVSVRGRSMWPLLAGGESLRVKRCEEHELERGQIAVLLRADDALVSHLVVGTSPLVTASFAGTIDAPGLEPLGRATAVRRAGRMVPLPALTRPAVLAFHRAWSWATRATPTRAAYALAGEVVASKHTAGVRTLLGRVEVQLLGPDLLRELSIALSRWETLSGATLESLVRDGVVVAATRRGRIVGCACVCPDKVLRHTYLQRRAQGLELELVMLEQLLREAEARGLKASRAEIHRSQPGFAAAVAAFGL